MEFGEFADLLGQGTEEALKALNDFIAAEPLGAFDFSVQLISEDGASIRQYLQAFITIKNALNNPYSRSWRFEQEKITQYLSTLVRGLLIDFNSIQNTAGKIFF